MVFDEWVVKSLESLSSSVLFGSNITLNSDILISIFIQEGCQFLGVNCIKMIIDLRIESAENRCSRWEIIITYISSNSFRQIPFSLHSCHFIKLYSVKVIVSVWMEHSV